MADRGNRERRRLLALKGDIKCDLCPPNRGDNANRKAKHATKPKKRNARRARSLKQLLEATEKHEKQDADNSTGL
jgi:hypothetical protein